MQLGAAASTGVAQSQTPLLAGNLTLNGSLVTSGIATTDVARRIQIASTGADSAIVFTVVGTDRYGNAQSETVTGVANGSPQYTARDYKTVTRIGVSGATAGAITAGTNTVGSSDWVIADLYATTWDLAGGIAGPAGTTYTLEETYDDPNKTGISLTPAPYQFSLEPASYSPPLVWAYPAIIAASGMSRFDFSNHPIFAHRLTINSGTGRVTMQTIQSGSPAWSR